LWVGVADLADIPKIISTFRKSLTIQFTMDRKRIKEINEITGLARTILSNKEDYVILDTETTGLGNNDVIIQLAVIDLNGNALMDTLIRPTKRKRMSSDASAIHGITMKMLQDSPSLRDVFPQFKNIVRNKTLLVYNAPYDARLFAQTANQDGFSFGDMKATCMMRAYSIFIGEWNPHYNDYKFQRLKSGDHSAIGDCRATLKVIKEMADCQPIPVPKEWWEFWKN